VHIVQGSEQNLIEAMLKDGRAKVVSNPNPVIALNAQKIKKTVHLVHLRVISAQLDGLNKRMKEISSVEVISKGYEAAYAEFMACRHRVSSLESTAQAIFYILNNAPSIFSNEAQDA